MSEDIKIQEAPPEIQFAGVNRWLKENLFSSFGSGILTIISIAVIISLFRSIIGFFISPNREWTAVTYNLRLYMVQAYPQSDFNRVWYTVGLVILLLGLTWGYNSVNEKVLIKTTGSTLLKLFSSLTLLALIAPSTVVTDKVERTEAVVLEQSQRISFLIFSLAFLAISFVLRQKFAKTSINKDYITLTYFAIIVASLWFIRVPTVTFDSSGTRIDPDSKAPPVRP